MAQLFPPQSVKDAVYNAIPKAYTYNSQQVNAQVVYANQDLSGMEQYPLITLGWVEPTYQGSPLGNLMDIAYDAQSDQLQVMRGVRLQQTLDINVYDNQDERRIDSIAGDLYLALMKLDLSDQGGSVFNVIPPRPLDITEKGYIRRRLIELIVVYRVTWAEVVDYIETINSTIEVRE